MSVGVQMTVLNNGTRDSLTELGGSNKNMPSGCFVGNVGSVPGAKKTCSFDNSVINARPTTHLLVSQLYGSAILNHWSSPLKTTQHQSSTSQHQRVSTLTFRSPATTGEPHTVGSGRVVRYNHRCQTFNILF